MRVLHVTRDYPPASKGGMSTAVWGLARATAQAGARVGVISFDGWRSRGGSPNAPVPIAAQGPDGVSVIRGSNPAHLNEMTRFGRDFEPTVVHVHSGMLWSFAVTLGVEAPRLFNVHVAQTLLNRWRGLTEETHSSRGYNQAVAEADGVVVPDAELQRMLVAEDPDLERRSTVIPFGIDDTEMARAAVARREAGDVGSALLYVGRFADVKGTAELLEVLAQVSRAHGDLPIRIVGGIPGSPKKARRWRRRFEEKLPAKADWTLTGWLSSGDVSRELADARVLLVPSHMETFGLVALEGMDGLPVTS